MIIPYVPSVAKSTHRVCPYHQKHPGKTYAGCTCASSYWLEPKPYKDWTDEDKMLAKHLYE